MKTKFLLCVIAAVSLAGSGILLAQTTTATGTVVAVSQGSITIQQGPDQWVIKRVPSTQVTGGELKVGSTVTLKYNAPDGQKREGPVTTGTATPPPAGQ
jgi:flagellar basal body P-ring protein FlgI